MMNPLPTGVKNIEGKVIINPQEKKRVILDHFIHRKRPVKDDIKNIEKGSEELYNLWFKAAKIVEELEATLKSIKTGKSRDPDNMVCDIFKEGVIGHDLKHSILLMMNKIKKEN